MQNSNNKDKPQIETIYKYNEKNNAKDVRDILQNAFIAFINSKKILFK